MKKIFISILALSSIMLLMLSSCKKDETKAYSSLGSTGTLSASTTAPALSLEIKDKTAVIFGFAETPVSGTQASVTYTLQVDKKGNNFARPTEIAATAPSTTVIVSALNKALHNLGLADDIETQVEVRVKSSIAANADATYSNALTLTVTPYSETSYLYVPGGYQGWTPATAPTLSSTDGANFEGVIDVPATTTDLGFKLNEAPNWDEKNYGAAGDGQLSLTGGNITFPGTGKFKITANIITLTYTITKQ